MFKEKEQEIQEIINALYDCDLEELPNEESVLEDCVIKPFVEKYHKSFDWSFGATKLVLIFKDLNFVIKIPLLYCEGEELTGATYSEENWNYCKQESILSQKFTEKGLDFAIAKTEFLTDINGYSIYIQPYAETLSSLFDENSKNYHSYTDSDLELVKIMHRSDYVKSMQLNMAWQADLLSMYGENKYLLFLEAIRDLKIYDLRDTNVGYIQNRPVLIDYASFDY